MSCPHCGEDRQIERTRRGWFCNTCGREFACDFHDRREVKLGSLGTRIVDAQIRRAGNIPYFPDADAPHPFDRLVASPDKRHLCVVEVKTKCRREAYRDTGINRRHYDDYMHVTVKYGLPLYLAFVDAKEGRIYGNYWTELIKTRVPGDAIEHCGRMYSGGGCESYPWEHGGIVYFPLTAMETLHVLTVADQAELLALRRTKFTERNGSGFLPKSRM